MENINQEEKELYLISKIVAENVKGRKIALWGDSRKLRDVLKQYFNLEVSCVITLMRNIVNNKICIRCCCTHVVPVLRDCIFRQTEVNRRNCCDCVYSKTFRMFC